MQNLFKNFDWSFKSIAKIIGMILLGIIALTVVISLISFSIKTIFNTGYQNRSIDYDYAYDMDEGFGGEMVMQSSKMALMPPTPKPGYSAGNDAEDYEVKEYYGTIQTRKLDDTCAVIADLKSREEIIFESSDKNKDYCNYRFKVINDNAEEIIKLIEDFKPENFNASIYSIKKSIEGYDNELDILSKKLQSIEDTLEEAQKSYDEISKIATRQNDAETLANIINSKLKLIDKLTNERLQTKERIDRYNKNKADQLDRLNYTFFNINVYKDLIFDWKDIKDSWKYESKELIQNINVVFQGISLHLAAYLVRFAQAVIYLFISLFLLKFVWIGVKRIWKGKKK